MSATLLSPLADVPTRFPAHTVALIHEQDAWTWGQLDIRSRQWCLKLQQMGVRPDDLVAFALPNGLEFFALTFGIYRAGATPAPLSPKLPERERVEILQLMAPCAFLTEADGMDLPDAPSTPSGMASPVAKSWKACTSGGSTGRNA
jgi:bile acid-coenzyme A ligase